MCWGGKVRGCVYNKIKTDFTFFLFPKCFWVTTVYTFNVFTIATIDHLGIFTQNMKESEHEQQ